MAGPGLVELLAYLNFLVQGPKSKSQWLQDPGFKDFKATTLSKLASNFKGYYTVSQIKNIFLGELGRIYAYPNENFDRIFLEGSSALGLDEDTNRRIQEHLDNIRLQDAHAGRCLRSRGKSSTPVTRRRERPKGCAAPLAASSTERRHRARVIRKNSFSRHMEVKPRYRDTSVPIGSKVRRADNMLITEIGETPSHSPLSPASTQPTTSKKYEVEPMNNGILDSVSRSKTCNSCSNPTCADFKFHDLMSELSYYKQRCQDAEQECEDLKKMRRQLEISRNIDETTSKVLQENKNLKRQMNDRKDIERYFSISEMQGDMSNQQQISSKFQIMKNQFPTLLIFDGKTQPSIKRLYGNTADLDDLLCTVFGTSIQGEPAGLLNELPALEGYELILALTGAAIYLWIFASEYRTPSMTVTPLVQQYRKHIETLCGNEKLDVMDLAVHRAIIRESGFKNTAIPYTSATLTMRLMNAFQPLFDELQMHSAVTELRGPLEAILSLAVQIRSEILVSTEDYERIWPSIGSPFDGRKMQAIQTKPPTTMNMVRLPLCPGLQAFPKEKGLVKYDGLKDSMSFQKTPKYIIEALVLD